MSEEEKTQLAMAVGELRGRLDAMEVRQAKVDETIAKMDGKLDTIVAKLNQSMGGLAAGKLFAAVVTAIAGAAWAVWSHFFR